MMLLLSISLLAFSQLSFAFNTYDCSSTKSCQFKPDGCNADTTDPTDPKFCKFGLSWRRLENDPDFVMIEMRRPRYNDPSNKNTTHSTVYVAMGLSTDDQMGNDSVVQCVFYETSNFNDSKPFKVDFSWNYRHDINSSYAERGNHLLPSDFVMNLTDKVANVELVSGIMTEEICSCTFKRRVKAELAHTNSEWHELWNLNENYFVLMAFGNANESGQVQYHETNKVVLSTKTNFTEKFVPNKKSIIDTQDCDKTKRCYRLPTDCDTSVADQNSTKYCKAQLAVTPPDKDGFIQMDLYATRLPNTTFGGGQTYLAAGFSKTEGMFDASVVTCIFREDGNFLEAHQSYNWKENEGRNNSVLPQEINSPNVKAVARNADDNYFSCSVKRKVSPLMHQNQTAEEVFALNKKYTLIMAWGLAREDTGGALTYHYDNKGVLANDTDVTIPFKTSSSSTQFLSLFTCLFAIATYFLMNQQ